MAQRHEAKKHHQQAQAEEQAASLADQQAEAGSGTAPAGGLGTESIARLQLLGELHGQGILTDDELAAQKAKILAT
jgi:hypothetical protein